MGPCPRSALGGLVAALTVLGAAPAAHAAVSVSRSGATIVVDATNVNPFVTLSYRSVGDELVVSDGGGVSPGAGCDANGSGQAFCDADGVTRVVLTAQSAAGAVMGGTVDSLVPASIGVTVNGGSGNDVFDGGRGDDVLDGGSAGAADFDGGAGDDVLTNGGTANPAGSVMSGGDGADTVTGSGGNNVLVGGDSAGDDANDGADTITGGPLQDDLDGGLGADVLDGGGDDDELTGGRDGDTLRGGAGDDDLLGELGDDRLEGGGDDDLLVGGAGADTFDGGSNTATGDLVDYSPGPGTPITASIGGPAGGDGAGCPGASCEGDTITDTVERILGDSGGDTLTGNAAANTLDGAGGADTLRGGTGSAPDGGDRLVGGTGTDRVTYAGRSAPVVVDLATSTASDGASGEGDDVRSDVEDLEGGDAGDTLGAAAGGSTLRGGPGDDALDGLAGNDTFHGGTGLNTGPDGADDVDAGGGVDVLTYVGRTDAVNARIGSVGNVDGDAVGSDVENLVGGSGDDTLTGDGDVNAIDGAGGNDTLAGGNGPGPDGGDTLVGGPGAADRVTYATRAAADGPGVTADLDGAAGDDGAPGEGDTIAATVEHLTGGADDDTLTGGPGANVLDGGAGNDLLRGGTTAGADGADTFVGGTDTLGDRVTYVGRTADLTLDLDGVADDGAAGEGDRIDTTVDSLTGGSGDDDLTGDGGFNGLAGGPGDDDMRGGASTGSDGNDVFDGDTGTDLVDYSLRTSGITARIGLTGPESDIIGSEIENLRGGAGNDTLTGDAEANRLEGGGGDDTLLGGVGPTADGADVLVGGGNGATGDTASYAPRTDPLTLTIGGAADGAPAEGDVIGADVENLVGGAGEDRLVGSAAVNRLDGGAEDDTLLGGAGPGVDGADVLVGGAGTGDVASYETRTAGVVVDLDGAADDGAPGEGDRVDATVEGLVGGAGADDLTGDANGNRLSGGGSDDVLRGGPGPGPGPDGPDRFDGDGGRDLVDYGPRTDAVQAAVGQVGTDGDLLGSSVEDLRGGAGDDDLVGANIVANTLDGGPGADRLRALTGDDTLLARDGVVDDVECGGGTDSVTADATPADLLDACETVSLGVFTPPPPPDPTPDPGTTPTPDPGTTPPPPADGTSSPPPPADGSAAPTPPPATGTGDTTTPAAGRLDLTRIGRTLRVDRTRGVTLRFQAPAGTRGTVTLTTTARVRLREGGRTRRIVVRFAQASFRASSTGAVLVRPRLSTLALRRLRALGSARITVRATASGLRPASRAATLRPPAVSRRG